MVRLAVYLIVFSTSCLWVEALDDKDTQPLWDAFKDKYNKTYDSPEEEKTARGNFEKNMLHVALHNVKDEHEFDKDVHEYSDLSISEQRDSLCGTDKPADNSRQPIDDFSISERALPKSVNWVTAGKVSSVKNQGSCGSCWTFSAAQALEGQVAIQTGEIHDLSEQQLVDCASNYGNNGCDGGWPQNAFKYIKANGGLVDEDCYPYQETEGSCEIDNNCERYTITGYKNVGPEGDEVAVANALATNGPLTCAIYVSDDFMHYGGGVYTDKTYKNQDVNHGVLLVGYGTQDGKDYWLIKNSWGTSWGEDGYMKLIRNDKKRPNHLKVASYTSYPTV